MKKFISFSHIICFALVVFFTPSKAQVVFEKRAVDLNFDGTCSVNAADINGDSLPDILSTGWDAGVVAWWANDGSYPPSFSKEVVGQGFTGASYVYPGDIDGDGDIDLVASAWNANRITVWWNQGDNPVTWSKQGIDSSFHQAHEVKVANIDGTGGMDIVAASALDNQVSWWQNNGGSPVQWTKHIISTEVYGARSVFSVDIDNDGDIDILSAGLDDDDVSVFINEEGNPVTWTEQIIDGEFNGAHWIFAMDMDKDNDMDVLAAGYMAADIAIWYNEGGNPISWAKFILDASFPGALSVVAANLDGDEFPDVVAAGDIAADVRIYYNDGTGTANYTKVYLDPAFYGVWPVFVNDLDNDTDMDILATSSTNDDIYWWDNQICPTGVPRPAERDHGSLVPRISPNPFREATSISFHIQEAVTLRVELFSGTGSQIRTLFDGFHEPGLCEFSWDGKDDYGCELPGGIYLCCITAAETVATGRIMKLK